jgi:hypothetical protein
LGPLIFCTLYWWAGREFAYAVGGAGMFGVCALVFGTLKMPKGSLPSKINGKANGSIKANGSTHANGAIKA